MTSQAGITARGKISHFIPNPINLSWGVGSLGTITMLNSVTSLYLFFLVGVLQMEPALAGALIFASKLVDVVSDPVMGWISDQTRTRWGRRRPYMFGASFLCGASMVLLFNIPEFENEIRRAAYIEFLLIFYALVLTVYNVPYLAMPAEMTEDYRERSNIMSYRALFLVGGSFTGTALSGLILGRLGGDMDAYGTVGWFLAAASFAAMMICVWGTRRARFTNYVKSQIPTANQFKLFLVNKPFLVLGGVKAVQFLQLAAGGAATLFFFVTVLEKGEEMLFPFGIAFMLASVLSIRFWLPVIHKFGKRETFMLGLILQTLIFLSWLLATPTEPMWIFLSRAAALGASSSGIVICGQSMIVDAIEYDRKLSGLNREGITSSAFSFLEKTMYATGPLIIGVLLTAFGFDETIPRGQPQPDSALFAVTLGQAWIPAVCSLVMFAGLFFYNLTEKVLNETQVHEFGQRDTAANPAELQSVTGRGSNGDELTS